MPESRPIAVALAETVVARGADRLFGVPGGGTNLEVIGECAARGLPFVLAHTEGAAAMMAATYGYMTGRPALVVAGRGPGCANSVNGVAQATLDRFPLVLATDGVPAADTHRVAHQYLDQVGLMAPVCKWSGVLGSSNPAEVARAAFELAGSPPAGAVHLTIDASATASRMPVHAMEILSDENAMDDAIAAVSWSRRPVIIVGNGAVRWADDVTATLAVMGCPVLTTYQGAGLAPADLFAGLYTGGGVEQSVLDEADLVIAVGLDPVEPIPSPWRTTAQVVSISPSPLLHRYWPEFIDLIGPVGPIIRRLAAELRAISWEDGAGPRRRATMLGQLRPSAPVDGRLGPVEVVETAAAAAPPGTLATVDAGAHFLAVMPWWPVSGARSLLISNGLATMGFALPAAIGMALARPATPVVAFVGDGGLGMVLAELETAARLGVAVTVVVLDDAALSLIEIKQGHGHGGREAVRYADIDFAATARSMGLAATTVDTTAGLAAALDDGWDRPRLIRAMIDPSGYPHLLDVTRSRR